MRPAIGPIGDTAPAGDSTKLISPPAPGGQEAPVYYRTVITVRFRSEASAAAICATLARISGEVIGGFVWDSTYVVRVPDLGPTFEAYQSALTAIEREPAILRVGPYNQKSVIVNN